MKEIGLELFHIQFGLGCEDPRCRAPRVPPRKGRAARPLDIGAGYREVDDENEDRKGKHSGGRPVARSRRSGCTGT